MNRKEASKYLKLVDGWTLKGKGIERDMKFKNFVKAIGFINKVADVAEEEGHHPDINLYSWNRIKFTLSTHAIKGLSINDFILASKINSLKT